MKTSGRCSSPAGATKIDDLIDDLVELILLHIPCRAGLVRSAATCKRWRRLIAGAGFLRRFRSLHRPEVVGHYYVRSVCAVFLYAPKPPREIASGFRPISLFHLTRLPYSTLTDSRGGLVACFHHLDHSSIVVFNPWIGKHKQLHAPACGTATDKMYAADCCCLGAFLLDDAAAGGSMSYFKVLCVHLLQQQCSNNDNSKQKLTVGAQVYSARDDSWLLLSTAAVDADDVSHTKPAFVFLGRAGGSLFWFAKKRLFHLKEVTGTFSFLTLPMPPTVDANSGSLMISYSRSNLRVVDGDDTGSIARLVRVVGDVLDVLRYNVACVLTLERRVHLSQLLAASSMDHMAWCFVDCKDELADRVVLSSPRDRMFVVDVDNMTKLLVPAQDKSRLPVDWVLPYELPWPPIIL